MKRVVFLQMIFLVFTYGDNIDVIKNTVKIDAIKDQINNLNITITLFAIVITLIIIIIAIKNTRDAKY